MAGWLRKGRGLAGLSAVGAAAGALFGAAWSAGIAILFGSAGINFVALGAGALVWGGFGAFTACGVGIGLAVLGSGKSLSELSVLQAGTMGLVLGAAGPLLLLFSVTGTFAWGLLAGPIGMSSVLGSLLGGGLVAAAKRADSGELGSVPLTQTLTDGSD